MVRENGLRETSGVAGGGFAQHISVVVRRLVDTIRVNDDDTITVILKGGIEITEPLNDEKH